MPEWLLSFCVHVCLITGTIVSLAILGALLFVVVIEIHDIFHDPMDDEDEFDQGGY